MGAAPRPLRQAQGGADRGAYGARPGVATHEVETAEEVVDEKEERKSLRKLYILLLVLLALMGVVIFLMYGGLDLFTGGS